MGETQTFAEATTPAFRPPTVALCRRGQHSRWYAIDAVHWPGQIVEASPDDWAT